MTLVNARTTSEAARGPDPPVPESPFRKLKELVAAEGQLLRKGFVA